ncbi:hypothetical protein PINS_up010228 [Pythium insidiosum]|nr:hypothetical protein PINS_up010228 [Pythium insidiosum]
MHLVTPTAWGEATALTHPPRGSAFLWGFVAAIHGLFALNAAYVGLVYVRLPIDAPTLLASIELYAVAVPTKYFKAVASAYFCLVAVHSQRLLRILYVSVRSRRLLLMELKSDRISTSWHRKLLNCVTHGLRQLLARVRLHQIEPLRSKTEAAVFRTISDRAMLSARTIASATSVTDPNYGTIRAFWELIESAFLTAQVYKSSCRVASQWINTMQVVLLMLNCWCYSIVSWARNASVVQKRLFCLMINVCIDTIICIVIPTLLFVSYMREYDPTIGEFGILFWYTDRWLLRLLNEFPMLFVTSLGDAISRFLINVRIVRALMDISRLFTLVGCVNRQTQRDEITDSVAQSLGTKVHHLQAPRLSRIERGLHVILSIWGLVVLGIHAHAASMRSNPRCLEQVRPWTARRAACSLAEISCAHGSISGRAAEFDAALQEIDRKWLTYLIIRHCPAIEMTSTLQDLPNIVGLKTYNSTLARWGPEAALTAQHHVHVRFVFLAATNMSAFPRGLYDANFPSQLMDVETCRSNLTSLPATLSDVWPQGMFLLLEETQLMTVPPVLGTLRPFFLSLSGHTFTSIPAVVMENPLLLFLKMNGNPLSELPEVAGNDSSDIDTPPLMWLYVSDTDIADVPSGNI